jgi:hypothetical protein
MEAGGWEAHADLNLLRWDAHCRRRLERSLCCIQVDVGRRQTHVGFEEGRGTDDGCSCLLTLSANLLRAEHNAHQDATLERLRTTGAHPEGLSNGFGALPRGNQGSRGLGRGDAGRNSHRLDGAQ